MLNCISFPSLSDTGLFLRRAYSCLRPVAEPTARSVCLAPDIDVYFVLEMATISYSLCHFTPWVSLKFQLWLWITSNSSEMGIGSRRLQRLFLHLTIIDYFGTYFLIFVTFSTSGRVVALITADISMAPLCQGIQGIQQTLQRASRCPWCRSYQQFLNGTRQRPACTAERLGMGRMKYAILN